MEAKSLLRSERWVDSSSTELRGTLAGDLEVGQAGVVEDAAWAWYGAGERVR